MNSSGRGPRRIGSGPEPVVVPARAGGGAEVAGCNVGGNVSSGGTLHEREVVRTRRLVQRVGQIHDAPFNRKLAAERLEAGVAEVGVFDARHAATRKKSDGGAADAGRAVKPVRGAAEVVNEGVIPVAQKFADHPDARATDIDTIIEALRRGRRRIGPIVVAADIEVHPAGDGNAIEIVSGTNGRPVARHRHDYVGQRNRRLDRDGGIGAGYGDPGVYLRVGFRGRCCIG